MTNKELQKWLSQFPDDVEMWKDELGCHHLLTKIEIGYDYTTDTPLSPFYWVATTECQKKVKRIII